MVSLICLCLQASSAEMAEGQAFGVALRARVTDPGGHLGSGLTYDDFFDAGYGAAVEGSWLSVRRHLGIGAYASVAWDRFGGDGFTDDLGDSISLEALDRLLLLAGGRLRFFLEEPVFQGNPLFIDVRLGVGAAHYFSTDGDFVIGGTPLPDVRVIESGFRPAGEGGLSVGLSSRTFSFSLGAAVRLIGEPEAGNALSSIVDPGLWVDVSFEFGWELRL